jgi:hypothetical protein
MDPMAKIWHTRSKLLGALIYSHLTATVFMLSRTQKSTLSTSLNMQHGRRLILDTGQVTATLLYESMSVAWASRRVCWILCLAEQVRRSFDAVEWASEQTWSSGKVGLLGISYYAGSQWRVAALQPKGLAAMIPWEGMSDYYRFVECIQT